VSSTAPRPRTSRLRLSAAPRGRRPAARAGAPAAPAVAAPSRRQREAEQTRRHIVVAARQLFEQRGFEAATTTDIAAAAGVAKGTLFLHARTKEGLLVMVYEDDFRTTIRDAFAHPRQGVPIASALATLFCRFFPVYERNIALARHFVKEVMFLRGDEAVNIRRLTDEILADIAAIVANRKARGEVAADVDPALAAANSFLLYYGVLTAWLSGRLPDATIRDRMLADSLRLHWRGLDRPGRPRSARTRSA
jgi:AcrR family transcriptional regulator